MGREKSTEDSMKQYLKELYGEYKIRGTIKGKFIIRKKYPKG